MTVSAKVFIFALLTSVANVYAQSPHEQLQRMVEQLRQAPTDNALRGKIIKQVGEMKSAPALPPEAKRAFVMGTTYQKEAKTPEDFGLAVNALQEATTAAPWWGDAYYNLSVALESLKRYDEAKRALELYLLTEPKDAEQAQQRIYAIDAKKVMAARQQADAARAAVPAEQPKKSAIEGNWVDGKDGTPIFRIDRTGQGLSVKSINPSIALSGVQVSETALSVTFTYPWGAGVRHNLELRGGVLVNTSNGYRFVRKP